VKRMEKTQIRKAKGLDMKELKAQRVQLLPDRIEMHRRKKRIRRQNLNCGGTCFITNA
jgi:hypothetical protein